MTDKKTVLTYEGLKKLEAELQDLKVVRRREVAQMIKEARNQGDLSENAEYDAAKEEQAAVEARIVMLEKMLRNAEVIDEESLGGEVVSIGSKVTVFDIEYDEKVEYLIVGSTEADPMSGRISNESPLGIALIGRSQNEVISVEAPDGPIEYCILEIA
ncbi:MAG: transcription elongation factor GreA [Defluviitaleaceae bacterium]|nr:transcription elongation factor GreA [Defluviitaleaceae bacterium]